MIRAVWLSLALALHWGCTAPLTVQPTEGVPPTAAIAQHPAVERTAPPPAAPRSALPERDSEPARAGAELRGVKIVVDAGHGGKDPGAKGLSAVPEKTLTLALARELAGRLKARGATVVLTRADDRYLELDQRARVADSTRADLFVSLHADSASRAGASGVGAFIARNALGTSQRASREILRSIQAAGLQTRGVQRAGFRVLVGHQRPAVLIECGFLTNARDAKQLNSASYRSRLAEGIAEGIERCLGS